MPLAPPWALAPRPEAARLDFHGDPAERIIYATAAARTVPLVSKDRRLADHAAGSNVEVIW